MNDFEKRYYEASEFWEEGALDNEPNLRRINATMKMIPQDAKSLADIGCGNGKFGNYLLAHKPELEIIGVDRSETAISFVNTEKILGDILNIPLPDASYDCVSCLQVLEHIPHMSYRQALSELVRVSRKYILISVPYNENLKKNFTECPNCHSTFNADLHLRNYHKSDVDQLFAPFGFSCLNMENVGGVDRLAGYTTYLTIRGFLQKPAQSFRSPICPICGYENDNFKNVPEAQTSTSHSTKFLKQLFKTVIGPIKKRWPREPVPGYWIVALYGKNDYK